MMSKGHNGHNGHEGHNGTPHFKGIQTFIPEHLNAHPIQAWNRPGSPNPDQRSAIIASGRYVRYSDGDNL